MPSADADRFRTRGAAGQAISVLNLSVRATNCLEAAKISMLRDLVKRTEAELLRFRSFGKTSLHESSASWRRSG